MPGRVEPTEKDEKWMIWTLEGAGIFSTCGKRQYMAVIVDWEGHVVSTGYNGGPPDTVHCIDGGCPRLKANSQPGSSYDNCIAIHAEQNALVRADAFRCHGGTIYVNGPPCYSCAKMIANSGLSKIGFTMGPDYDHSYWVDVERQLFEWGIDTTFIPYGELI